MSDGDEILKTCTKCKQSKPLNLFQKDRRLKIGRKANCLDCGRVFAREHYCKARTRSAYLIRKYGINSKQYDALYKLQKAKCAICLDNFSDDNYPRVDHCHDTGMVRGLLCQLCNTSEGMIRTIDNARSLLRYMEKNSLFYGVS